MATPGDFDDVLPWFRFFLTKTKYDEGTTVPESGPGLPTVQITSKPPVFSIQFVALHKQLVLFGAN